MPRRVSKRRVPPCRQCLTCLTSRGLPPHSRRPTLNGWALRAVVRLKMRVAVVRRMTASASEEGDGEKNAGGGPVAPGG